MVNIYGGWCIVQVVEEKLLKSGYLTELPSSSRDKSGATKDERDDSPASTESWAGAGPGPGFVILIVLSSASLPSSSSSGLHSSYQYLHQDNTIHSSSSHIATGLQWAPPGSVKQSNFLISFLSWSDDQLANNGGSR